MNTYLRWLASTATLALASINLATSTPIQTETLTKIGGYKNWVQMTPELPTDVVTMGRSSLGG